MQRVRVGERVRVVIPTIWGTRIHSATVVGASSTRKTYFIEIDDKPGEYRVREAGPGTWAVLGSEKLFGDMAYLVFDKETVRHRLYKKVQEIKARKKVSQG